MAKVEMDMTEYEALKRVETLLEQSRVEQKKLYEELDKVQKEKIQALSDMAHQVLYKKTIHHKFHRVTTPRQDIFESFIRRWEEFYRYRKMAHSPYHENRGAIDYLAKGFFDILNSLEVYESTSETEEDLSYRGLEEVKSEMLAELTLKIDEKSKKALAFQEANRDLAKLHQENETEVIPALNRELYEVKTANEEDLKQLYEVSAELFRYKCLVSEIRSKILESSFFKRGFTLSVIGTLIDNLRQKYENNN